MSVHSPPLEVKLWGTLACFTRPEMKVERVTYPVMTPSAARGVMEAIFWKPEISWRVEEIVLLSPIKYFSILRNEVKKRASERLARSWAQKGGLGGYDATEADHRAQRHTLALRNVAYIVRARMELLPHATDDPAKYRDQFRRRVQRGQCFSWPYLGCWEFSVDGFALPDGTEQPLGLTKELGPMLLDMDYSQDGSGRGTPRFFHAHLRQGILRVPQVQEVA
jgi:CRISPR-associated protein Cas5d